MKLTNKILIFAACFVLFPLSVHGALTKQVNGKTVQLTAQEEADVRAEWEVNQIAKDAQDSIDNAFDSKMAIDIAALGTRAEMRNATSEANSIPELRVRIAQLEEIVYSMVKGTID